jgi:hypothetical protein
MVLTAGGFGGNSRFVSRMYPRALCAAAVAAAATCLCASAGGGTGSVAFAGLPSQVYEGQTVTFTLEISKIASVNCTLTIRYTGKRVDRITHVGRNGGASWRIRVPAVPPGPARLAATCPGIGSATAQVLVQWALQTPKLTVTKQGFTEAFPEGPTGPGRVSYGLAIHNERVRFDATNVQFLVNFVDGSNRVLGTDHVGVSRVPSDTTVYRGAQVDLSYGQSDMVTRLEIILVSATSAQKVPSTPLLISDIQAAPSTPPSAQGPYIDSVRGQILNQSALQLQNADVGVIILDASGNVVAGGSGYAQGPLSKGSREFFSSCCSYGDTLVTSAASILVSAVPTYATPSP